MTLTLKKDVQKHIVTSGNYALAAAGQPLFTIIGSGKRSQIVYNVLPGQLVAYTINNGVTLTVDDATLAASDIYELYIGVGVDLTGNGITDDIRHLGIEKISGCEPREVSTSDPKCGNPQVVDFYFDCTQCDETYSVIVRIDDNQTQSFSPWNKSFSEFVGSIVTNCSSCDDCPVEHNCREVSCKLADALNAELDLKVGTREYPDWKGKGLPRPFHATRLHSNSFIFCLAPQSEAGACEDCTYFDMISGAVVNGNYHEFVSNTNPLDATQTLTGQLDNIVLQLNDLFITEYAGGQTGVDPHAGSAYATGTYQQCCSMQLHVNTCDANFQLLDVNGDPITPTTSNNPFTVYGTVDNDANCIDCSDGPAVKASGTLTLTGQPQDVAATGTLTLTGQPLDTETVVIGTKTYQFQTSLTDVDGNVLIGATASDSLDNLIAAINLGAGAGTLYATSTTANTDVSAAAGAGDTMDVTALTSGSAGNSIVTTETLTNGSWGGGTLSGGITETVTIDGKVYTFQATLVNADGNVHIGATAEESLDNLKNAINLGPGVGTDYATAMTKHPTVEAVDGTGTTLVVYAITAGTGGNAITTTETLANGSWGGGTLSGGAAGTLGTTAYPCGIRVIAEQIKGDCGCFIDKPLSFYGRKVNILPFGDGWKGKPWRVVEVQAMELPAGFGSFIQFLEYQTLPEGRGRRYDRSNINKGWANLPGKKARVRHAVTAECDTNYCSYYMKSFVEKRKLTNDYGVITVHSNVHVPNGDTTTISAWESFFAALIALNPSCKVLTTVNCNYTIGGC